MYAIYPFQKYTFTHYCMWDIDWKRLFGNVWITVFRIWSISQYLAAPFSHCKAMIDNMLHNSVPYFIWYAPLSLTSSSSSSVLPLYPSMHPYSSSSSSSVLPLYPSMHPYSSSSSSSVLPLYPSMHPYSSSSSSSVLPLYPSMHPYSSSSSSSLLSLYPSMHPYSSSSSSSVLPLYPSMHPYSSSSSRLLTLMVFWMFIHSQNL